LTRRSKDDKGQILSSLVAVLAVVAIVGGLLVLFGTRGNSSAADDSKPAASTPTPKPSTAPVSTPTPSAVPSSTPTSAPTSAPTSVPTNVPTIPVSERPAVEVYNNTSHKGLAEDVSIRARQAGWTVAGRDNWHGKIVTSTVYFPAGMQAEAAQLAKDIGVGRIKDALDNMKKDRLTVILTTDYAG
jgi:pyruvate/2-oxoglutarate dehydrogenase complex dihydrolipoamide acyltransferase (E2) component